MDEPRRHPDAARAPAGRGLSAARLAALWLAAFAAAVPALAADPAVAVRAERRDGAFHVEAVAELRADPRVAWQVLTDYDRYADFIPDLDASRVLARSADGVVVEQRGRAGLLFLRIPLSVRYFVQETPYRSVRSRAIGGDFREMEGAYDIVPAPGGLRLAYTGRLVPGFMLPPLLGTVAVRRSVERQFEAMAREIERRAGAPPDR